MKKLSYICLLCFSLYAIPSLSQSKKQNKKTVFVEFNFLANNLGLKYNKLVVLGKNSGLSYSIGLSSIYRKKNFIVPPNLGIPIEINYLIGKRGNFIEAGVTFNPQLINSKAYTHFNKDDLEITINENTNLIYITPHIGVRNNINGLIDFKASVGPRIKIVESSNEYIGRIFENNKFLELFFLQLSIGFPL